MNKAGIDSRSYKEFCGHWDTCMEIARQKIEDLLARKERNELTEQEESSYLIHAMYRQAEDPSSILVEDAKDIACGLLVASVDTTAAMLSWHLMHIAQSEEAQEKIYQEISTAVADTNGRLTADALSSSITPYLNACMRESHRLTNPASLTAIRELAVDLDIHGITVPAGSMIAMDSYSKGMDPTLLDNHEEFRPERWLPDAVEARKGTPAAQLDHPLFSGPFSQGARRCPGSRVSKNEALILLAQLVLDWKMSSPIKYWKDVPYDLMTMTTPILPKIEFTPR